MRLARKFVPAGDAKGDAGLPSVTLTLQQRRRSRQRLTLDNGNTLGVSIDRGTVLRDGDQLMVDDGTAVVVKAALEPVLRVTPVENPWQLARAAYHLGNRHVLLEVGEGYLQLEPDAVLVDMLNQLGGVNVRELAAPFEPDVGAYGGGHHHGHDETFAEDYALAQAAYLAHEHAGHHHHHPEHEHPHGHAHADDHTHEHGGSGAAKE